MKKLIFTVFLLSAAIVSAQSREGQRSDSNPNDANVNNSNRNASSEKVTTVRATNPPIQSKSESSTPVKTDSRHGERKTSPDAAQNNSGRSSGKVSRQ